MTLKLIVLGFALITHVGRNFLENVRANPNFLKYFYTVIAGLTITK